MPAGGPPGGKREDREQRKGVDQVERERPSARDAGIGGDMLEKHETGADQRFGDDEDAGQNGAAPDQVSFRKGAECPDDQPEHGEQGDAAGGAMGELDEVCELGARGTTSPLQSRPVVAAAGAGSGGSDIGAPQHHQNVPGEHAPRVALEGRRQLLGGLLKRQIARSDSRLFHWSRTPESPTRPPPDRPLPCAPAHALRGAAGLPDVRRLRCG